jgi:hypothetical protein
MVTEMTRKRPARRRAWRSALIVGAVAVLATACVIDITEELGETVSVSGINDDGVMVGTDNGAPMRFENGTKVPLDRPATGDVYVGDINNAKEVLGSVTEWAADGMAVSRPVMWNSDRHLIELSPLFAEYGRPGIEFSVAGITENGRVAVQARSDDFSVTPARRFRRTYLFDVRTRKEVATVTSEELSVNAVAGTGAVLGHDGSGMVKWSPTPTGYVKQTFDANAIYPTDMNDRGDVVGIKWWGEGYRGPVVWMNDGTGPIELKRPAIEPSVEIISAIIGNNGTVVANWVDLLATPGPTDPPDPENPEDPGDPVDPEGPVPQGTLAVRYAALDAIPEVFPNGDKWLSSEFTDINSQGTALGRAFRKERPCGEFGECPVRWMIDPPAA